MNRNHYRSNHLTLNLGVGILGVVIGIGVGFMSGSQPALVGLGIVAATVLVYFLTSFEQAVLALLILRSSLDVFSDYQVPAAFALGIDALTILYVVLQLLTGQGIKTDRFLWFFAGWIALQGMWVVLLPIGGLGLDGAGLLDSIREWIRLFSWLMVYLLVMQLKDTIPPQKVIQALFWALLLPITLAMAQIVIPSALPAIFSPIGGDTTTLESASRIRGTLGHPNTFTTLLLFFIGLTWWQLGQATKRWPWLLLLGLLAFFYVSTKALFGLMMLGVLVIVLIAPRLSLGSLIGGLLLFATVIALFASSDFGQERLGSLSGTPLLNPDIDISRAILLSESDHNSFNWRLAQWTYLLQQWQKFPIFGFGLGLSADVSTNGLYPHNDYVRALVEGGIVGLSLFFVFFGVQIARLIDLIRNSPPRSGQRDLCLVLLAILLSIPVGMITENIWSHTTLFFYWWTLLAIAGWDWSDKQIPEDEYYDSNLNSNRVPLQLPPQ